MTHFNRYTITSALPYVNGSKHIGHLAGAYLPADVYVRFLRANNKDVVFVCGSDEWGTAITMQAFKDNVTPRELVDKYHQLTLDSFQKIGISFDIYHRTTEMLHQETAQEFFLNFYNKGLFIEKESEQYFDESNQTFLADRYIQGICPNCKSDKAFGDQCESCGKSLDPTDLINPKSTITGETPVLKSTKHWYLPLENYEPWLREWLVEGKKDSWKPNTYGQAKSWIDAGLKARSMTRDGSWGVPVPLSDAQGKILYVWFDAPIGYISATKQWAIDHQKDWEPYWKNDDTKLVHFVGKDNIVFHTIIFPIMLKAHGDFILPTDVPANEFLNLEGEKMSTSRKWSLEMHEYLEAFPNKIDELRYCLISNLPENKDSDFSWLDFQLKVNSELVAIAGNLVNRVFVLIHKFYDGKIPFAVSNNEIAEYIVGQREKVSSALERYSFREAMAEAMNVARYGNKLLTDKEPWKLFKEDPKGAGIVLHDCAQIIMNWAMLMEPFLPFSATLIFEKFKVLEKMSWEDIGRMNIVKVGADIEPSFYLYSKIEDEEIAKQIDYLKNKTIKTMEESNKELPVVAEVSFDDFVKNQIVVGTILEAEKVENADKLLKLTVDLGFEVRTIVSGIALSYHAEETVGKRVVVLSNLKPRKIKGIESKGMILLAEDHGKLVFVSPEAIVANGSEVK